MSRRYVSKDSDRPPKHVWVYGLKTFPRMRPLLESCFFFFEIIEMVNVRIHTTVCKKSHHCMSVLFSPFP